MQPVKIVNIGVKLPVRNLEQARFFYESVLGLKVEKESKVLVKCGCIVLVPLDSNKNIGKQTDSFHSNSYNTIYLEIDSIVEAYNNVCQFGSKILKPISERQGRRCFDCLDPDRNVVEIFEMKF
ncbi:MAG: VOC family protein [Rhizonema sp. PD37]|nr:VOC family protein [Rhizonema sp. PD37]